MKNVGRSEAIIQFGTNAIPWGKAPDEWLKNPCFKNYVHRKEDQHDKWLDDEVEKILVNLNLQYDRNVKKLNSSKGFINIDIEGLGELDFIIIAPAIKKIFISDCKHLLGRYDIVNQRNDFNAFEIGSNKTKPYNQTMKAKLTWFNENKHIVQDHFKSKYSDSAIDISEYAFESIFIINTPTIYMYNSVYIVYILWNKFQIWY
ncbi:MAG: hypothetical protein IPJ32_15680 [Sphingobacteriaceae bacterium]|nr:hypothetical protein [Sphingobacteriaceae bacterium]